MKPSNEQSYEVSKLCIAYLTEHHTDEKGLFRSNVSQTDVRTVQSQIIQSHYKMRDQPDPHLVAEILQTCMKDMTYPLLYEVYDSVVKTELEEDGFAKNKENVQKWLGKLSPAKFRLVSQLFNLLSHLCQMDESEANLTHLSSCIAPSICRTASGAYMSIRHMEDLRKIRPVISFLIANYEEVFAFEPPTVQQQQQQQPQNVEASKHLLPGVTAAGSSGGSSNSIVVGSGGKGAQRSKPNSTTTSPTDENLATVMSLSMNIEDHTLGGEGADRAAGPHGAAVGSSLSLSAAPKSTFSDLLGDTSLKPGLLVVIPGALGSPPSGGAVGGQGGGGVFGFGGSMSMDMDVDMLGRPLSGGFPGSAGHLGLPFSTSAVDEGYAQALASMSQQQQIERHNSYTEFEWKVLESLIFGKVCSFLEINNQFNSLSAQFSAGDDPLGSSTGSNSVNSGGGALAADGSGSGSGGTGGEGGFSGGAGSRGRSDSTDSNSVEDSVGSGFSPCESDNSRSGTPNENFSYGGAFSPEKPGFGGGDPMSVQGANGSPSPQRWGRHSGRNRRRMVMDCKALRTQIYDFEQDFTRKNGHIPKGAERGAMQTVYSRYRELKKEIRDLAAVDLQRVVRGFLLRKRVTPAIMKRGGRRISSSEINTGFFASGSSSSSGSSGSGGGSASTNNNTSNNNMSNFISKNVTKGGGNSAIERAQTAPGKVETGLATGAAGRSSQAVGANISGIPMELYSKYRDLLNSKRDLKRRLKKFDEDFVEKHGRQPKKADKEVIRPMYQKYHEIKGSLDELKRTIEAVHGPLPDDLAEDRSVTAPGSSSSYTGAGAAGGTNYSDSESEFGGMVRSKSVGGNSSHAVGGEDEGGDVADIDTLLRGGTGVGTGTGTGTGTGMGVGGGSGSGASKATGGKNSLDALQTEKRNLHAYLKVYERDFQRTHDRPVMKHEDIQPVAHEYQRYKELKQLIKDLKQQAAASSRK